MSGPASGAHLSVCIINNYGLAGLGGGEVQLLSLVRGLAAAGVETLVVCAEDSGLHRELETVPDVRVLPVSFSATSLPSLAKRIAGPAAGSDVVHGTGYLTNLLARRVGARTGARVVNAVHVIPGAAQAAGESSLVGAARSLADRSTSGKVDRFVAVSGAVASALAADGIPASRITVVPNSIDLARLEASAEAEPYQAGARGERLVGYVGRLERVKGCEFFLRAAETVLDKHPSARFILAGEGSDEGRLREIATASKAAARIEFVGHVRHVGPLLCALDVAVVPSLSESFGLTAVEAMALGTPVVASRVGGLPEIVVDGVSGLLVEPGDAPGIAQAILRVLDDADLARRLSTRGSESAAERFTVQHMVDGYLAVYREVAFGTAGD